MVSVSTTQAFWGSFPFPNLLIFQVDVEESYHLDAICELLLVDRTELRRGLTIRMLQVTGRQTAYTIRLTYQQALENRDSMAKVCITLLISLPLPTLPSPPLPLSPT